MSLSSENTVMTMPVTPAYQGCSGGYGFGGDFGSWIILFLLFGIFGGYGNGFGGFGCYGGINSPAGQGIYLTALLRPPLPPEPGPAPRSRRRAPARSMPRGHSFV